MQVFDLSSINIILPEQMMDMGGLIMESDKRREPLPRSGRKNILQN